MGFLQRIINDSRSRQAVDSVASKAPIPPVPDVQVKPDISQHAAVHETESIIGSGVVDKAPGEVSIKESNPASVIEQRRNERVLSEELYPATNLPEEKPPTVHPSSEPVSTVISEETQILQTATPVLLDEPRPVGAEVDVAPVFEPQETVHESTSRPSDAVSSMIEVSERVISSTPNEPLDDAEPILSDSSNAFQTSEPEDVAPVAQADNRENDRAQIQTQVFNRDDVEQVDGVIPPGDEDTPVAEARLVEPPTESVDRARNDMPVAEPSLLNREQHSDARRSRPAEPNVHIGQIDVIVQAPQVTETAPVKSNRNTNNDVASRRYLRRL